MTRERSFIAQDAQAVEELAAGSSHLSAKVREAMDVLDEALRRYSLEHLALSFNGGKDCTVLVHLLAATILRQLGRDAVLPAIQTVYVRCKAPFAEVESFVDSCAQRYALELDTIDGGMLDALADYKKRRARPRGPGVEAILVGTRRNDPHGAELRHFKQTDEGWPDFMRVHPILDWSYADVWDFLRHPTLSLGGGALEWCELYDYGYTSLGSTFNTFPNPQLRAENDSRAPRGWLPAWQLTDDSLERAGREGFTPPPA